MTGIGILRQLKRIQKDSEQGLIAKEFGFYYASAITRKYVNPTIQPNLNARCEAIIDQLR